jgi:hypothetical protein
MAAPLGYKDFITGEVLTANDVDGYLMQGIWVFASAAARDAAVTSPQEGNACYLKDTDVIMVYTGSAWATQSASNPISANIVDAKGDLIAGTAADTVARLAVGTNDQVLVADSTTATGLKWATPTTGGGLTLLSTTTLSGASTTVSSISGSYKNLQIVVRDFQVTSDFGLLVEFNSDATASNYMQYVLRASAPSSSSLYADNSTVGMEIVGFAAKASTADYIAVINIYDYASTATYKVATSSATALTNASAKSTCLTQLGYWSTTAISSLKFKTTVGTWSAGTVLIYGVN